MYTTTAIVLVAIFAAGLAFIWAGWRDRRDPTAPPRRRLNTRGMSRRTRTLAIVGIAVGALTWLVTGWFIALIVIPTAIIGIPTLLGGSGAAEQIQRLTAMDEWVRNLSSVLLAGHGIDQAIIATHRSIPTALNDEISRLIQRLRANVPLPDALRRFAADLDDATGDLIAGALIQASAIRGPGLATVLERLAESVNEDIRNRRAVEASRKGARVTAHLVTMLTVTFIAVLFIAAPDFMHFYTTPGGQIVFLGLAAAFAGVLLWMKRMIRPVRFARFLANPTLDTATEDPAIVAEGALR